MSLDRESQTDEITSVAQAVEILASDATNQLSDEIDASISPLIPDNLPTEVWDSLMDDCMDDIQIMLQQRIQWLVQSANAEVKEIQLEQQIRQQILELQIQQQIEQARIQAEMEQAQLQEQDRHRQSEVIYTRQDTPVSSKVIPDPKLKERQPQERKVLPPRQEISTRTKTIPDPIPTPHPYTPRQLELQASPFSPPEQGTDTEEAPRRKRRRSGVWQSA